MFQISESGPILNWVYQVRSSILRVLVSNSLYFAVDEMRHLNKLLTEQSEDEMRDGPRAVKSLSYAFCSLR